MVTVAVTDYGAPRYSEKNMHVCVWCVISTCMCVVLGGSVWGVGGGEGGVGWGGRGGIGAHRKGGAGATDFHHLLLCSRTRVCGGVWSDPETRTV